MRRPFAAIALVLAAGCGTASRLPTALPIDAGAGIAFRAEGGLTVLDPEDGEVRRHVDRGIASGDGRWVFGSTFGAHGTTVSATAADGSRSWEALVDGWHELRAVSAEGDLVALLPAAYGGDVYAPTGRRTTELVVMSTQGGPVRTIELAGNYEPEAFTADGEAMFVIEYLPAEQPDRYRVRRLDLATEQVTGVHSLDGHLQQAMRGTARIQALAEDGRRLYTLYTVDGETGPTAFVHVLDLVDGWAHCVDLPPGVGGSPEAALAVAAVPDRGSVVVVDGATGQYTEIDAETLVAGEPRSLGGEVPAATEGIHAAAVGQRVFVGGPTTITSVDLDGGAVERWDVGERVLDLRADPSGDRLWAAVPGFVRAFDLDGTEVAAAPAPDIEAPPPVDDGRAGLQCAC